MRTAMSVSRDYVSASVNRYTNACDWGHRLIAYASCNAVAIFSPEERKVTHLLNSHTAEVRCVRWITADKTLVSASADTTAIVWKAREGGSFEPHLLLRHDAPVMCADSSLEADGSITTVTSSTDLKITLFKDREKITVASIDRFSFDLRLLPNIWGVEGPVIAYATDDSHLNIGHFDGQLFVSYISLPGHEDWIRSIDYFQTSGVQLLLVSASQDGFLRMWKIERKADDSENTIGDKFFIAKGNGFRVSLETVLAGHEGPVMAVKFASEHCLLTASSDKTLILWSIGEDDVWTESVRVGEVGGNNLGFMGCTFPPQKSLTTFAGYSHNGAIHVWNRGKDKSSFASGAGFGGHRSEVVDVAWEPEGKYLLSVSMDETTRLHAKCVSGTWHEIARPQIHGYEINCLAVIDGCSFVTGADEKVVRVFRATKNFVINFAALTGSTDQLSTEVPIKDLPVTSAVPALGLTNRAVFENEQENEIIIHEAGDAGQSDVPSEETLMQRTLWPEIHKLYGHGNELFAVGVNHRKSLLVSACKSAKAEHAGLICWKISEDFRVSQKLSGHQLTVTSIKFSPDDKYLVSVSRDRTWYLYRETESDVFEVAAFSDKKTCVHSRIIWDVSWAPDSTAFLTCSRDKKLLLWQLKDVEKSLAVEPLTDCVLIQDHAVMTCDILGHKIEEDLIVAIGMEDGTIGLFRWSQQKLWRPLALENVPQLRHHLPVRKVRFKTCDQI